MNVAGQSSSTDSSTLVPPTQRAVFADRRAAQSDVSPVIERRQFANTHSEISDEARRLGKAIDQYKLVHRRRFITYEEMLTVIKSLGYRNDSSMS